MGKKETASEALANLQKLLGVDLSQAVKTEEVEEAVHEQTEFESLTDARALEAESVVFYIETKGDQSIWKKRTCTQCGSKFLSTYTGVSLCTNECRKDYLASKGIVWNPIGRTESERWGGTIPRVIGPTATEKLQGMTFPNDPEPEPESIKEESSPVADFDVDEFINSLD